VKKIIFSGFLLALLTGSFIFYWFQLRPTKIRSQCDQVAWYKTEENGEGTEYYDWKYMQCLHSKGLK